MEPPWDGGTNVYRGYIYVPATLTHSHSIQCSTGTYPFKLESDYIFCNEVKEGVSAIRRFDWSRENIRHTGITLSFVGLPVPT